MKLEPITLVELDAPLESGEVYTVCFDDGLHNVIVFCQETIAQILKAIREEGRHYYMDCYHLPTRLLSDV